MCLAIPGRVEEITSDGLIRVGRVNFGGVMKRVCLDYVPEIAVGDYTLVHVGFALAKVDEQTALETLETFRQMGCWRKNWRTETRRWRWPRRGRNRRVRMGAAKSRKLASQQDSESASQRVSKSASRR